MTRVVVDHLKVHESLYHSVLPSEPLSALASHVFLNLSYLYLPSMDTQHFGKQSCVAIVRNLERPSLSLSQPVIHMYVG